MKKRHYFLESTLTPEDNTYTIISPEQIKHFKNILKLEIHEEIVLTNGRGYGAIFEIVAYQKEGILVDKVKDLAKQQLQKEVTLACAILKQDHFELVTQKATELGVTTIVPLLTERTVKSGLKEVRIQKIVQEAGEQSERLSFPTLLAPMTFKDFLGSLKTKTSVYLLDPSGVSHREIAIGNSMPTTIIVGPEGGWTDNELAQAREVGVGIVSLGNTILRAETAAIVGTFWVTQ